MPKKRYKPEEIVARSLRQVDVVLSRGYAHLRDELLNGEISYSPTEARRLSSSDGENTTTRSVHTHPSDIDSAPYRLNPLTPPLDQVAPMQ